MPAESIPGVHAANLIRLRRSGPVLQGELEVTVSGDLTIRAFTDIRKQINAELKRIHPEIERIVIYAIPQE
ncbi:MAG: hypothetical protein KKC68_01335 [Candidatus Thermoplasmatota archaeon]|nr:hypothetical protein [Candidatus Thermoplasmatota archaeon]MBU1940393.1 hypothetical protein [Candidatus Thermoplasmatota archaeon]